MDSIIRCRQCGSQMEHERIDDFKVKFYCKCGFSEFRPAPGTSKVVNPHYSRDSLLPLKFDHMGRFVVEVERADREQLELITIDEISMLASSDYDLDEVLKKVAEKTARRLGMDICSIYLWDGEHLVLRGTYGLAQEAVGKARLKPGEGITGTAVLEKKPQLVADVSRDPRYHYFPETREEQYRIKTMYSYPIFSGDEPYGVLNVQTVETRRLKDDELGFVAIVANLILGAVKMRKKG
ncbi:MAG TPA: GAF domain-containing protein [Deltaproteobacteria bacterium]|nr:GAF domain-containing protein [Deltaproteobacteria bacterium]